MNSYRFVKHSLPYSLGLILAVTLTGCPPGLTVDEYEEGFVAGFAEDEEYWLGYDDSYFTVPDGPLLYSGSEIPAVESPPYDAGYWDGVWYAYNDGYFVSYDDGFTIGFSEGYDLAYYPDWYDFLLHDTHYELLDGSFQDGYTDGFSEGRIYGAVDYAENIPFDWEDAMWEYREGVDLYIESLDLGTGDFGPVYLYEYGVDPHLYYEKSARPASSLNSLIRRPRVDTEKRTATSPRAAYIIQQEMPKDMQKTDREVVYRPMKDDTRRALQKAPTHSPREDKRALTLTDTWLDRIQHYRNH